MYRRIILVLSLIFIQNNVIFAQKYLILETANKASTLKMAVGDELTFRLAGDENYWYSRTIKEIKPDLNALLLDEYLVPLKEIVAIKIYRNRVLRITGATLFAFGASLGFATILAAIDQDRQQYPALIATSLGSLVTGRLLLKKRKIKIAEKHRLRIIEIPSAKDLLIPLPPIKKKG